tara:strand:+ start:750 stop:968 length:219 start_codon:yes stop_codon:yes gene_type:complete
MVSKKDLKVYEWTEMYEYYEYIVTSYVNGQHAQVKKLINDLSMKQKKDASEYFDNMIGRPYEEVRNVLIKNL